MPIGWTQHSWSALLQCYDHEQRDFSMSSTKIKTYLLKTFPGFNISKSQLCQEMGRVKRDLTYLPCNLSRQAVNNPAMAPNHVFPPPAANANSLGSDAAPMDHGQSVTGGASLAPPSATGIPAMFSNNTSGNPAAGPYFPSNNTAAQANELTQEFAGSTNGYYDHQQNMPMPRPNANPASHSVNIGAFSGNALAHTGSSMLAGLSGAVSSAERDTTPLAPQVNDEMPLDPALTGSFGQSPSARSSDLLHGVDSAQSRNGATALTVPSSNPPNYEAMFSLFNCVISHENINRLDETGRPALHVAVLQGCKIFVEWLLEAGADASVRDGDGQTLQQAVMAACAEVSGPQQDAIRSCYSIVYPNFHARPDAPTQDLYSAIGNHFVPPPQDYNSTSGHFEDDRFLHPRLEDRLWLNDDAFNTDGMGMDYEWLEQQYASN